MYPISEFKKLCISFLSNESILFSKNFIRQRKEILNVSEAIIYEPFTINNSQLDALKQT